MTASDHAERPLLERGRAVAVGTEEVGAKSGKAALRGTLTYVWTVLGPFLGLLAITALFAWWTRESGRFMALDNWRTIAVQTVVVGTAALGMTIIMIAGGIDLSVGSVVALVTVVAGLAVRDWGWSVPAALALGVAVGGLCGL